MHSIGKKKLLECIIEFNLKSPFKVQYFSQAGDFSCKPHLSMRPLKEEEGEHPLNTDGMLTITN